MPPLWKIRLGLWVLLKQDSRDDSVHAFGAPRIVWEHRLMLWRLKSADESMQWFDIEVRWHPAVTVGKGITVPAWWEYVNIVKLPGGTKATRSLGAIKTISLPDAVAIAKEQTLEILEGFRKSEEAYPV